MHSSQQRPTKVEPLHVRKSSRLPASFVLFLLISMLGVETGNEATY